MCLSTSLSSASDSKPLCTRRSLHHRNVSAISILRVHRKVHQRRWTQTKAVFRDECRGEEPGWWLCPGGGWDPRAQAAWPDGGVRKHHCRGRVCLTYTWICFVLLQLICSLNSTKVVKVLKTVSRWLKLCFYTTQVLQRARHIDFWKQGKQRW